MLCSVGILGVGGEFRHPIRAGVWFHVFASIPLHFTVLWVMQLTSVVTPSLSTRSF
jgi:hypothetical protein